MKSIYSTLLVFLSTFCFGQTIPSIDALIDHEIQSDTVAALAIAIIDSGKIVHMSANGYRDVENNLKASINTPFHIASISKTVTNLAIFKLVEAGKIDLNTDINNYLPFAIKNPHYPNDVITVRDLLNHRSGIKDDYEFYTPYWTIPKGDPTLKLSDFLKDYLDPAGQLYKKEHYESSSDYKSFSYSNTGVALLGFIVEHVSGMTYEAFCQENIFKPLEMSNTSWFLKNLDTNSVAKTYAKKGSTGLEFKGHNGYPDYPAGQLRTSISDFSKLMIGYLNADNNKFILQKETTSKITPTPEIAQEGFFTWFLSATNNTLYYVHAGGDIGVRTIAMMDVDQKRGIIIFANSEYDNTDLLEKMEESMWNK